jgi:Protein of unknown function (DUF4232)
MSAHILRTLRGYTLPLATAGRLPLMSTAAAMLVVAPVSSLAVAATSRLVTVDVKAPKLGACTLGELKVGPTTLTGAAGVEVLLVPLTVRQHSACTLKGYPIIGVRSPGGRSLPLQVVYTTKPDGTFPRLGPPRAVTVSSTERAYFGISFSDNSDYAGYCSVIGHLDMKLASTQSGTMVVDLPAGLAIRPCFGQVAVSPFLTKEDLFV